MNGICAYPKFIVSQCNAVHMRYHSRKFIPKININARSKFFSVKAANMEFLAGRFYSQTSKIQLYGTVVKKNYKILLLFLAFYFFHCSFFLFFIALYNIFSFLNHSLLLFDQTFVVILFISLWSRIYNLDVFFPAFIIIG